MLRHQNINIANYWHNSGTRSHITATASKQNYKLSTKYSLLHVKGPELHKLQYSMHTQFPSRSVFPEAFCLHNLSLL